MKDIISEVSMLRMLLKHFSIFVWFWYQIKGNWPTRPRPNRWSLFLYKVSVRPSITKTKTCFKSNVEARKTKCAINRTPCVKIMTINWLGPGGSLWNLPTCLNFIFEWAYAKFQSVAILYTAWPSFFYYKRLISPLSSLLMGGEIKQ